VIEGLRERNYVLRNADYLSNPIFIVLPCKNFFWANYYRIGLIAYHLLFKIYSEKKYIFPFKKPTIMKKAALQKTFPNLHSKYKYGVVY